MLLLKLHILHTRQLVTKKPMV